MTKTPFFCLPRLSVPAFAAAVAWLAACKETAVTTADAGDDAPPEAVCEWAGDAEELPFPEGHVEAVLDGESRNARTTCTLSTGTGGPEKVYVLRVPESHVVKLEVLSSLNTVVAVRTDCTDPLSEVACGDATPLPEGAPMSAPGFSAKFDAGPSAPPSDGNRRDGFIERTLRAGVYFVVVDQEEPFGVGGPFSLRVSARPAPLQASCATPLALEAAGSLTENLALAQEPAPTCGPMPAERAFFYSITIPSGEQLTARASQLINGRRSTPTLALHGGCGGGSCLATGAPRLSRLSSDIATGSPEHELTYVNNGPAPVSVILSLGSDETVRNGTLDLSWSVNRPILNTTCALATPVSEGVVQGVALVDPATPPVSQCSPLGTTVFYKATLAPDQQFSAALEAAPGTFPQLSLSDGCGPQACLQPPRMGRIDHTNRTGQPQTVVLAVSHSPKALLPTATAFTLSVMMPPPPGTIEAFGTEGLVVDEAGATAAFGVRLTGKPVANVTLALEASDPTEGRVTPAALVFTPDDWATARTVTVSAVDDDESDGRQVFWIKLLPAASTDRRFGGVDLADVAVINLDNEPGLASRVVSISTSEGGRAASVPVRLNRRPSSDVTVKVTTSVPGEAVASPAELVFAPDTWQLDQVVTVKGIADAVPDGNTAYALTIGGTTSSDPAWVGVPPLVISGINREVDFTEVAPKRVSDAMSCGLGFSKWDRRLAMDGNGRVYVGLVCALPLSAGMPAPGVGPGSSQVYVTSSNDGGLTFTRPVGLPIYNVSSLLLAGGPAGAYVAATGNKGTIFSHSADGGATWASPTTFFGDLTGFATLASSRDAVLVGHVTGERVVLSRIAELGAGTPSSVVDRPKNGDYDLFTDPEGLLWQWQSAPMSAIVLRSDTAGATFAPVMGGPTQWPELLRVTAAQNMLWGLGRDKLFLLRFGANNEAVAVTDVNRDINQAIVADDRGGVTLFTSGTSLIARRFTGTGLAKDAPSRTLDGQASLVMPLWLADKAIGYTYAVNHEQRFGVLVW